jgi:hypothetical protein
MQAFFCAFFIMCAVYSLKKMKRTLLGLLLIVSTIITNAQSLNLTWGPVIQDNKFDARRVEEHLKLVKGSAGVEGSYWLNFEYNGRDRSVSGQKLYYKFSKDNDLIYSGTPKVINDEIDKKITYRAYQELVINGQIAIPFLKINSKPQTHDFYFNYLDEKLQTKGAPNLIWTKPVKTYLHQSGLSGDDDPGDYEFFMPKDEGNILISHYEADQKEEERVQEYMFLDKNLQPLWQRKENLHFDVTIEGKRLYFLKVLAINHNTIYWLVSLHKPVPDFTWVTKLDRVRNEYFIYAFKDPKTHPKPLIYKIEFPDRNIKQIQFIPKNSHEFIITGTYGGYEKYNWLIGVYSLVFDENTKKQSKTMIKPFENDFLVSFSGARRKINQVELFDFRWNAIMDFITSADNSKFVKLENVHWRSDNCYSKSILFYKLDSNGQIIYANQIQKYRKFPLTSIDNELFRSKMFTFNNKLFMVYEDNIKNLSLDNSHYKKRAPKTRNTRKNIAILASIDDQGNVTKQRLVNSDVDDKFYPMTNTTIQLDNKSVKMVFKNGDKIKICTIAPKD